jgi:archaeosortase A (PGF-CTERM-specific)
MTVPVLVPASGVAPDWLAWLGRFSDPLAAVAVAGFLLAAVLERRSPATARPVAVGAWVAFGAFWAVLVPHFALVQKSAIEAIAAAVAVPLALSAATELSRGRDSLFVLSRAVGLMGLVSVPFFAVDPLAYRLAETVTRQTEFLLGVAGYADRFTVVAGTVVGEAPARNTLLFRPAADHRVTYTIRLACTGLASFAMFGGGVLAVRAPTGRKLRALVVSVPVIWVLNLLRNAFIAIAFGTQRLHVAPDLVLGAFGATDPYLVSYLLADRVLAQSLSVLALVGVTVLVVRTLPELVVVLEEGLYLLTRREVDLRAALADANASTPDAASRTIESESGRPGD